MPTRMASRCRRRPEGPVQGTACAGGARCRSRGYHGHAYRDVSLSMAPSERRSGSRGAGGSLCHPRRQGGQERTEGRIPIRLFCHSAQVLRERRLGACQDSEGDLQPPRHGVIEGRSRQLCTEYVGKQRRTRHRAGLRVAPAVDRNEMHPAAQVGPCPPTAPAGADGMSRGCRGKERAPWRRLARARTSSARGATPSVISPWTPSRIRCSGSPARHSANDPCAAISRSARRAFRPRAGARTTRPHQCCRSSQSAARHASRCTKPGTGCGSPEYSHLAPVRCWNNGAPAKSRWNRQRSSTNGRCGTRAYAACVKARRPGTCPCRRRRGGRTCRPARSGTAPR